jgi:hypothetical protein
MQTRQIVGIVFGSAGVLISVGHLVLMMIFQTREPYHGFGTWLMLGLVLTVVGILLLRKNESE